MRFTRYLIAAAAIIVLMVSLRGWSSASVDQAGSKSSVCSPQPCTSTESGWSVAATNLQYDASAGNEYTAAEAGVVFVQVEVTFSNRTGRDQRANPQDFVLRDATGLKHQAASTRTCALWQPMVLTPGRDAGPKCLAFNAAAGHPAGLILMWSPQLTGARGYSIRLS